MGKGGWNGMPGADDGHPVSEDGLALQVRAGVQASPWAGASVW